MIWKYVSAGLLGIIIVLSILFGVKSCTSKKEIQSLNKQLNACMHAPIRIDTIIVKETITDTIWKRPKERTIHDTIVIPGEEKWCSKSFYDIYTYQKGKSIGKIGYQITVKDCETAIRFPLIELPVEIRTITKQIDTCISKEPEYKPKNHGFIYLGTSINNFTSFPAFQAGIGFTFKDKWMIQPGAMYNPIDKKLYGQLNVGLYLW